MERLKSLTAGDQYTTKDVLKTEIIRRLVSETTIDPPLENMARELLRTVSSPAKWASYGRVHRKEILMQQRAIHRFCFAFVLIASTSFAQSSADSGGTQQHVQHNDSFVPGSADESRIAREVRHQLVTLPYYGIFDDLGFRVSGGEVTLVGAVTRPTLKSEAENVTKRVEGVTSVVNNIEVLPLSPNDESLRVALYRAIYGDPSIGMRYGYRAIPSIHIIVKNGQATLEGLVANQGDKNLINIRANGVPGVFSVTNSLVVEGAAAH